MNINVKIYLMLICCLAISIQSCQKTKEEVLHRRNFSKNVFEDEFKSVKLTCDTFQKTITMPNTKWLKVDEKHRSPEDDSLYVFKMGEKFSLTERNFKHDLFLEGFNKTYFMFRYNGIEESLDTVHVVGEEHVREDLDSFIYEINAFFHEGKKYYRVDTIEFHDPRVVQIVRKSVTADKGRVVCTCDEMVGG